MTAMKTTLIALGLCLPLEGAEKKKTDAGKAGYKGRVKSVRVSRFKIEEKFGKPVRTQVLSFLPRASTSLVEGVERE